MGKGQRERSTEDLEYSFKFIKENMYYAESTLAFLSAKTVLVKHMSENMYYCTIKNE